MGNDSAQVTKGSKAETGAEGLDATDGSSNGSWSNYRVRVLPREASEAGWDGRAVIPVLCLGFLHWLG
ncbi:hypothetical protein MRX96_028466 [Rhipicephalus microplus]